MQNNRIFNTLLLITGIIISAWLLGSSLIEMRRADRIISVKGSAEQLVPADTASWTLYLSAGDDDLGVAVKRLQADRQRLLTFLKSGGLSEKIVKFGAINLTDQKTDTYGNNDVIRSPRYVLRSDVSITTGDVLAVEKLSQQQTSLIEQGVRITGSMGPNYYVNNINAFKGDLLKTAAQNALQAAKDFATATNATVGKLKDAQQGVITISGASLGDNDLIQIDKRVRVVSTLSFYLD